MKDSNFAVIFSQISLHPDKLSEQVFDYLFDDLGEIVYKLVFYQEPANSIFLYNKSPFVFAPAINGNLSTKDGKLSSFYSKELKKTFWVGSANKTANFFELPSSIFTFIDSYFLEFRFLYELYLYNYDPVTTDPVGYTIFSIEDDNENIVFEIKHYLNDFDFDPPNSFSVKVEIWIQEVLATSKDLTVSSMLELRQIWVIFKKTKNENLILEMAIHSINKGYTFVDYLKLLLQKVCFTKFT